VHEPLELLDNRPKVSLGSTPSRILEVKNLRKVHEIRDGKKRGSLVVFDGLNFEVNEGELVTIVGPSGVGKSTLLNVLANMEPYEGGEVVVTGHRVSTSQPDIILIFQEDALFPWLTVAENVAFGLRMKGVSKEESRAIASRYIALVQLTAFSDSYVHQLSGGMKQRVAIARALALNPRILLMDEPFGALDYRTREGLQREIQEIHAKTGKTILLVTHDIREAVSLGDRVILMSGKPARIKQQYVVDLERPRSAGDPRLHALVDEIMHDIRSDGSEGIVDEFSTG